MSSTNYDDRIEEAIDTFSPALVEIEEAFKNRDMVLESFLISQLNVNFFANRLECLETALKQLEFRLNKIGSQNDDVVLNRDNESDHLAEIQLQGLTAFYNKYNWNVPNARRLPHGNWDFLTFNINNQQNGGIFITGNVYNTPEIFHIRYQGTNKIVHIVSTNETRTFQTFDQIVQFLNQRFP